MFTSCCPGWVRFVKTQYPDMVKNLSTAKSPQQMFGANGQDIYRAEAGHRSVKVFSVSIMPCVAKKYERSVPQVNDAGKGSDVDLVLTTRELDSFIRSDNIKPEDLTDMPFDSIFGEGSGAGVIFGTTGGVMEAALRSAYYLVSGENPQPDAFKNVRAERAGASRPSISRATSSRWPLLPVWPTPERCWRLCAPARFPMISSR